MRNNNDRHDKIRVIRPFLIDNYSRIIKSLASRGRNTYQQFLIQPLSEWSKQTPVESIEKLMNMLENEERKKSKKVPLLYKMSIIKSVSPEQLDLSIPGNLSIGFLKAMKNIPHVLSSDEALEFMNALRLPFKNFSDSEFNRLNKKFENDIDTADTVEVENLIKSHVGENSDKRRLDEASQKHMQHIKNLMRQKQDRELKRQIILYLLRFSIPSNPSYHQPVLEIIDAVALRNSGFKKEIMDDTAVIIYDEILKAIKKGDLGSAVKYIGRYTVIFRGNPNTPNYHEVDSFEKKFISIIETKNLWDRL